MDSGISIPQVIETFDDGSIRCTTPSGQSVQYTEGAADSTIAAPSIHSDQFSELRPESRYTNFSELRPDSRFSEVTVDGPHISVNINDANASASHISLSSKSMGFLSDNGSDWIYPAEDDEIDRVSHMNKLAYISSLPEWRKNRAYSSVSIQDRVHTPAGMLHEVKWFTLIENTTFFNFQSPKGTNSRQCFRYDPECS